MLTYGYNHLLIYAHDSGQAEAKYNFTVHEDFTSNFARCFAQKRTACPSHGVSSHKLDIV